MLVVVEVTNDHAWMRLFWSQRLRQYRWMERMSMSSMLARLMRVNMAVNEMFTNRNGIRCLSFWESELWSLNWRLKMYRTMNSSQISLRSVRM